MVNAPELVDRKHEEYWLKTIYVPGEKRTVRLVVGPEEAREQSGLPKFSVRFNNQERSFLDQRYGKYHPPYYLNCTDELYPNGNFGTNTDALKGGFAFGVGRELCYVVSSVHDRDLERDQAPSEYVRVFFAKLDKEHEPIQVRFDKDVLAAWAQTFARVKQRLPQIPIKGVDEFASEEEEKAILNQNDVIRSANTFARHLIWEKAAKIRLSGIPLEIVGQFDRESSTFQFTTPPMSRVFDAKVDSRVQEQTCFQVSSAKELRSTAEYQLESKKYNEDKEFYFLLKRKYEDVEVAKKAREQAHTLDVEFVMSLEGSFLAVGYALKVDGEVDYSNLAFEGEDSADEAEK